MSDENGDRLQVRIAVGCAFTSVGAALAVVAMTSILQPEPCPWWAILILVFGGVLFVTGLLILTVSPKRWKHIWHSVLGFPKWLHETCVWRRYGPVCSIGEAEVTSKLSQDGQMRIYTATVPLSFCLPERTKNYCPVRVIVARDTVTFHLEQRQETLPLEAIGTTSTIALKTLGKTTPHEMVFSSSFCNNPSVFFIDLQQAPCRWIIGGIEVHLANIKKFRKLSKRGKVIPDGKQDQR